MLPHIDENKRVIGERIYYRTDDANQIAVIKTVLEWIRVDHLQKRKSEIQNVIDHAVSPKPLPDEEARQFWNEMNVMKNDDMIREKQEIDALLEAAK